MYVRSRSNLGQVPQSTVTLTVGTTKATVTGAAHEVGPASALVAMLNSAVTGAQKGQHLEARAVIQNAKAMLPSTGSLKSQLESLISAAEAQVASAAPASQTSSPNYLLYGGLGAALLIIIILLRR